MGFFSKIFKGIKKGFKKIGKGIKSAFKSFGKFMGKIGILGQVAMMFILPAIGGALMKTAGSAFSSLIGSAATTTATGVTTAGSGLLGATGSGIGATLARGAGTVLKAAGNFVTNGANVFRNVTEGVTNFIGNFSKTAANKLSGVLGFEKVPFTDAASTFFGSGDSAWARSTSSFTNRMSNLTGSKDFIKGLDEAAIEVAKTPAPITTATPTMGTSATSINSVGPLKEGYVFPETSSTMDSILSPSPDQITKSGTADKVMEDVTDTSWWSDRLNEAKATLTDEVKNFVPNTIKRTAETVQSIPSRAALTKIDQALAPDPVPIYQSSGGAQLQTADIGSGELGGTNPRAYEVNYGVDAGAMPYGANAARAGYFSFLNTSLGGISTTG